MIRKQNECALEQETENIPLKPLQMQSIPNILHLITIAQSRESRRRVFILFDGWGNAKTKTTFRSHQFHVQQATKMAEFFIYRRSNMLSTESGVNISIGNTLHAMKLSVVGKSGLSDKMKQDFFQDVSLYLLSYDWSKWNLLKRFGKPLDGWYTMTMCTVLSLSWKQ